MKNKKSEIEFDTIVKAAIALVVLLVIGGIIYNIIVGKQIPFISGKIDETTIDCDDDEVVGIIDDCPCDPGIKQKKDKEQPCELSSETAERNCPSLCKK